jgi:SAM-dependent methyltransferase
MNKAKGYYFTKDSINEYISMSEGYDGRDIINKLIQILASGSTILELGMGPGRDMDLLKNNYKVTGSDISPYFLEYYRERNPEADLLLMDAVNIATDRTFNAVFSNKVLQHLSNKELEQTVARQAEILTDRGIVYHTFWEGEGEELIEDLRFNYQVESYLRNIFSDRFEIIEISIYKELRDNDSIMILGRKI